MFYEKEGAALNPNIGSSRLKDASIRKLLITKHNKIYYQIKNDWIIFLALFKTRQHPEKNKYE